MTEEDKILKGMRELQSSLSNLHPHLGKVMGSFIEAYTKNNDRLSELEDDYDGTVTNMGTFVDYVKNLRDDFRGKENRYQRALKGYQRLLKALGNKFEELSDRVEEQDKKAIQMAEMYGKAVEQRDALKRDLEQKNDLYQEALSKIEGLEEVLRTFEENIVEIPADALQPFEEESGKGRLPYSETSQENPVETAQSSEKGDSNTLRYDITRISRFETGDAFNYVVMAVYEFIDPDKKEEDIEGYANFISNEIAEFIEGGELKDTKRAVESTSIGDRVMIQYFKEISTYLNQAGGTSDSNETLYDVVLSCCATVLDMRKDGKLQERMTSLKRKFQAYMKEHNKELF